MCPEFTLCLEEMSQTEHDMCVEVWRRSIDNYRGCGLHTIPVCVCVIFLSSYLQFEVI